MGTYLVTGIVKDIAIPKKHMRPTTLSIDNITASLQKELNLVHYTFEEDEDGYYWEIKPEALEGNLVEFLNAQFRMYQPYKPLDEYMEQVLAELGKAKTGQEIIDVACEQELMNFKYFDYFIEYLSVKLNEHFDGDVRVHYGLMAYFMDGKIIMECYKSILRYFEHLLRLQRDKFPIVDCVKVMISS